MPPFFVRAGVFEIFRIFAATLLEGVREPYHQRGKNQQATCSTGSLIVEFKVSKSLVLQISFREF